MNRVCKLLLHLRITKKKYIKIQLEIFSSELVVLDLTALPSTSNFRKFRRDKVKKTIVKKEKKNNA